MLSCLLVAFGVWTYSEKDPDLMVNRHFAGPLALRTWRSFAGFGAIKFDVCTRFPIFWRPFIIYCSECGGTICLYIMCLRLHCHVLFQDLHWRGYPICRLPATRLKTQPGVWFRCRWCFVSRRDKFVGPCSSWSGFGRVQGIWKAKFQVDGNCVMVQFYIYRCIINFG